MSRKKKILLALLFVFIAIQFIRPARNVSSQVLPVDITKMYVMPDSVHAILKHACYDCHSNNTVYPWYVNIQPFGWLLTRHINNGKAQLNFSEFGLYSLRRQRNKLNGIANSIKDGEMPLSSYKLMHSPARLSPAQKELLINWALNTKDSLSKK